MVSANAFLELHLAQNPRLQRRRSVVQAPPLSRPPAPQLELHRPALRYVQTKIPCTISISKLLVSVPVKPFPLCLIAYRNRRSTDARTRVLIRLFHYW